MSEIVLQHVHASLGKQRNLMLALAGFVLLGAGILAVVFLNAPREGEGPTATILAVLLLLVLLGGAAQFLWLGRQAFVPSLHPLYRLLLENPQQIRQVKEQYHDVEVHQSSDAAFVVASRSVSSLTFKTVSGKTYRVTLNAALLPQFVAELQHALPHAQILIDPARPH